MVSARKVLTVYDATADIEGRPSWACVLHLPPGEGRNWARADDGFKTCSPCYDRFRDRIKEIARRYLLLNPRPGASGDHGRGAPGFGSRSPASDHVIAMRDWASKSYEVGIDGVDYVFDPAADDGEGAYVERRDVWRGADGRAHTEQAKPPRSVSKTLASIADLIAEERDVTPAETRDVHELLRWIDRHMDWLTRQDMVADVYDELGTLAAQLRPVTGTPGRKRVGLCPNTIDEGQHTRSCKAPLYAPLRGDTISCRACGRKWHRPDWEKLGRMLQSGTDAAAS